MINTGTTFPAGEPTGSLNILPEETTPSGELSEKEVWSSNIEQQNAANKARTSSRKSDVISDDMSETDSADIPVMVRSNSRPTSSIIEGPIDFRRLSIGSKGDKGESKLTSHLKALL